MAADLYVLRTPRRDGEFPDGPWAEGRGPTLGDAALSLIEALTGQAPERIEVIWAYQTPAQPEDPLRRPLQVAVRWGAAPSEALWAYGELLEPLPTPRQLWGRGFRKLGEFRWLDQAPQIPGPWEVDRFPWGSERADDLVWALEAADALPVRWGDPAAPPIEIWRQERAGRWLVAVRREPWGPLWPCLRYRWAHRVSPE